MRCDAAWCWQQTAARRAFNAMRAYAAAKRESTSLALGAIEALQRALAAAATSERSGLGEQRALEWVEPVTPRSFADFDLQQSPAPAPTPRQLTPRQLLTDSDDDDFGSGQWGGIAESAAGLRCAWAVWCGRSAHIKLSGRRAQLADDQRRANRRVHALRRWRHHARSARLGARLAQLRRSGAVRSLERGLRTWREWAWSAMQRRSVQQRVEASVRRRAVRARWKGWSEHAAASSRDAAARRRMSRRRADRALRRSYRSWRSDSDERRMLAQLARMCARMHLMVCESRATKAWLAYSEAARNRRALLRTALREERRRQLMRWRAALVRRLLRVSAYRWAALTALRSWWRRWIRRPRSRTGWARVDWPGGKMTARDVLRHFW